jgi:hypothetical protein
VIYLVLFVGYFRRVCHASPPSFVLGYFGRVGHGSPLRFVLLLFVGHGSLPSVVCWLYWESGSRISTQCCLLVILGEWVTDLHPAHTAK